MFTLFHLIHEGDSLDVDRAAFQQMLPSSMQLEYRDDGIYLNVETAREEDPTAQYHVNRELDRLYFLTCVNVKAVMLTRRVVAGLHIKYGIHGSLPASVSPQNWTYNLAIQLRLWRLASRADEPLTKIILFFQIIELANPTYPRYVNSNIPLNPRTECKLLRHLVVHAGDVDSDELRNYCDYLRLPHLMLDRTDPSHVAVLARKVSLLESEARNAMQGVL